MLVINLFGAPGAGKSTGAAYIFSQLKLKGFNCELITEFAKDKVWEDNKEALKNQAYIFGKQYFRMSRCADKVDIIVTDSPLFLSSFYNTDYILGKDFDNVVLDVFKSYNNLNFFLNRVKEYNPIGRLQTEKEANLLSKRLKQFLDRAHILYRTYDGDMEGYDKILKDILKKVTD